MIHEARIRHLIGVPPRDGSYVLYWMQQAQRTEYNHALAYAVQTADELDLPLVVGFVLTPDFPEANLRHYQFMLQGIADVKANLEKADIPFVIQTGEMVASVVKLAEKAAWVVTDVGYLRIQRQWRDAVAKAIPCPFTAVETDVIVPVAVA
ncbi:MAG: deoxyribodipyrimidine photo-lyase, partial [Desulfobacterales bacterium]